MSVQNYFFVWILNQVLEQMKQHFEQYMGISKDVQNFFLFIFTPSP